MRKRPGQKTGLGTSWYGPCRFRKVYLSLPGLCGIRRAQLPSGNVFRCSQRHASRVLVVRALDQQCSDHPKG